MQVDIHHYQEMVQHAKTSEAQFMMILNTLLLHVKDKKQYKVLGINLGRKGSF